MKTEDILKHFFPEEILEYFDVVDVTSHNANLTFFLDEKNQLPNDLPTGKYESKGFTAPIQLVDFPIRDKEVVLQVRRRKWIEKSSGKIYSRSWDLTAQGTRYTKEFGAFLKGITG